MPKKSEAINIFIPGINKNKIQGVLVIDKSNTMAESLLILLYLLLMRAQLGAICTKKRIISQDKIPRLESAKWAATLIAKNQLIFNFSTLVAVADTLLFTVTLNKIEVSVENIEVLAKDQWEDLKSSKLEPGCRILPSSLIKNENLKSHQQGLILQNIGKWQAISLYDPSTLIRGISLANLEIDNFVFAYKNLLENLGIPEKEKLISSEDIISFISQNLYGNKVIFNDEIDLGLEDNKLPLEKPFDLKRIPPLEIPKLNIPNNDTENPLLKLLISNIKQQKQEVKKGKKPKVRGR